MNTAKPEHPSLDKLAVFSVKETARFRVRIEKQGVYLWKITCDYIVRFRRHNATFVFCRSSARLYRVANVCERSPMSGEVILCYIKEKRNFLTKIFLNFLHNTWYTAVH